MTTAAWNEKIVRTVARLPPRMLLYAPPGVGKTTFAASLPEPLLLDFDKGAGEVTVDKIPGPDTWEESLALVRWVSSGTHTYKTLAIDTIDPLESLATTFVCREAKKDKLGDFGFGSGYEALQNEWRVLLEALDRVRERGIIICLLGHSVVRQTIDPQLGPYDTFGVELHKKTWAVTHRWSDIVGFAAFDASRVKDSEKHARALTGARVLYTTRGNGFEAKNRYGLPAKMPLSWPALEAGIALHHVKPEEVAARILKLAVGTPFVAAAEGFVAGAVGDVRQLLQIEDALKTKLSELKTEVQK